MAPVCVLLTTQCPLCLSLVVWVREAGSKDRLICPVCWAVGERGEGSAAMRRGVPIQASLKYLVDKARFPRAGEPVVDASPPAADDARPGSKQGPEGREGD